jgi:hypothetical protein
MSVKIGLIKAFDYRPYSETHRYAQLWLGNGRALMATKTPAQIAEITRRLAAHGYVREELPHGVISYTRG